jgi:hypothetical protein
LAGNANIGFAAIENRVDEKIKEHRNVRSLDSFLWNGGTIAVLLATSTATIFPDIDPWTRVLTAFAGFWVAVERIPNFGGRWNFHRQMVNEYCAVKDMIDFQKAAPENEQEQRRREIMDRLELLRQKEVHIPGVVLTPDGNSA